MGDMRRVWGPAQPKPEFERAWWLTGTPWTFRDRNYVRVPGNCEEENSLVGGVSDGDCATRGPRSPTSVASHSQEFPDTLNYVEAGSRRRSLPLERRAAGGNLLSPLEPLLPTAHPL